MSGAAGHIQHLYEDRMLTFSDIVSVLTGLADGSINATEKLDGTNIMFSWDAVRARPIFARNSSDIKDGGISITDLISRFIGHENPKLVPVFKDAFSSLIAALSQIKPIDLVRFFGERKDKRIWYSAEIMHDTGFSTIKYGSMDKVVLHRKPVFEVIKDVVTIKEDNDIDELSSIIDGITTNQKTQLVSPIDLTLNNVVKSSSFVKFIHQIDATLSEHGLNRSNTIYDLLFATALKLAKDNGIPNNGARDLARRLMNEPSAPNITKLTNLYPNHKIEIAFLIASEKSLVASFIVPIENAIHGVACMLLNGVHSAFVTNPSFELEMLKARVTAAIKDVKDFGDRAVMSKLVVNANKLGDVENINAMIEGAVFDYSGKTYKITGAFAPVHQILSLQRKAMTKMTKMTKNGR